MSKLKLLTILGTRPEIIKLSQVIKLSDLCFEHTLVHTGQNWDYNLNEIFFSELGLRSPDYFLGCVGASLGETVGNIIAKSYEIFTKVRPDAVLILGDTNSALSAISAKRLKVPIFHMEAGNRCFDENLPEEINRKIVDHISDINLPYTEHARRNLLAEGIKSESVFVTGSPMPEVIKGAAAQIEESKILKELKLKKGGYFIVSAHREENIDDPGTFCSLMDAINFIAEHYKMPVIYSMHPRSKKFIEERAVKFHKNIRAAKPFGFFDYNSLQKNAFCVLSDSGTLAEESNILNFPAVSLRTSTERPEVLDKGSFIIGGVTRGEVLQAVELAVGIKEIPFACAQDYTDVNVSAKVVKIIQSYTGIVNRTVWRKF